MDLKPAAIGQSTQKEEVTPKLVTVTITPTEQQGSKLEKKKFDAITQQTSDSEKISAFSGETSQTGGSTPTPIQQLGGSMQMSPTFGSLQPTSSKSQASASSVFAKSPKRQSSQSGSKVATQMYTASGRGSSQKGPEGLGSLRSNTRDFKTEYYAKCCGLKMPVYAKKKEEFFKLTRAKELAREWNELIRAQSEYKPKSLPVNLDNLSDSDTQLIFGGSDPLHVFSGKCRKRIKPHVEKLSKGKSKVTPASTKTKRKNPGKAIASVSESVNYDTKTLIFDETVPEGHYIQSFSFIDNCTDSVSGAEDNRTNALRYGKIGEQEFLVNPERLRIHWTTGDYHSSAHADLYLPKGDAYANIGPISNHTGLIPEGQPDDGDKIKRSATYNPN